MADIHFLPPPTHGQKGVQAQVIALLEDALEAAKAGKISFAIVIAGGGTGPEALARYRGLHGNVESIKTAFTGLTLVQHDLAHQFSSRT